MSLVRRLLVLLAALVTFVVGSVVVLSPASADVIDGAIVDVQIVEESADFYDNLTVNLRWCVPNEAREGDTFYLDLPDSLRGMNSSFELTTPDGEVIAHAAYADGRVTFTLTDVADELNRVCGTAFFAVRTVKELIDGGEPNDFVFDSNSDTFEDTVDIGEAPDVPPGTDRPNKSGDWVDEDQDRLTWRVETGVGPWADARMVDTVGPGQAIDCTSVEVQAGPPGQYSTAAAVGRFAVESCTASTLIVTMVDAADAEGFRVRYQADITDMTLDTYTNSAEVVIDGRTWTVSDEEERTDAGGGGDGDVNPAIDIEKWSTVDGYPAGDYDTAPGKELVAGTTESITLTITNTGEERLIDVSVADTTGAGPDVQDLTCDFAPLGGPGSGTTWAGPFLPETSFECTATLPAMNAGQVHDDTADVTGTGRRTGTVVTDADPWHAHVVAEPDIDIEKWSTVDGYPAGDYDDAPGKPLQAGTPESITLTITNTGTEQLVDVEVSDVTLEGPQLRDLTCDFSSLGGPVSGTTWNGPFQPDDAFECTAMLPALDGGETHSDRASVTGVGRYTGTPVDDDDPWHGRVTPEPEIDIEKWSTDQGPLDGDFDDAPGLETTPGEATPITMTITNTGNEALVAVRVRDRTDEGLRLRGLTCDFSALGGPSSGTRWSGPFQPGDRFECTATLPPLPPNDAHADTAIVDAAGEHSGTPVDDKDQWHGHAPPTLPEVIDTPPGGEALPNTGGPSMGLTVLGSLMSVLGSAVLVRRRRQV